MSEGFIAGDMVDKFEKGVNLPIAEVVNLVNDMLANMMGQLSEEEVDLVHEKLNIAPEEGKPLDFGTIFRILNCYTKAMDTAYNYNDEIAKGYQNFVAWASDEKITENKDPQHEIKCFVRFISNFTSPLMEYFSKFPLGIDREISNHLSLLPPIIRYFVLSEIYGSIAVQIVSGKDVNVDYAMLVIDKYSLAILKTCDATKAMEWVEKNKFVLDSVDMYQICTQKIEALSSTPVEYSTFSQAYATFSTKWRLPDDTEPRKVFTDRVRFYYNSPRYAADILLSEIK